MAPRRVTRNSWCHRLWVLKKEQRKEILPRLRVVQWHEFFFTTGLPLCRHGHHWSLPLAEEADGTTLLIGVLTTHHCHNGLLPLPVAPSQDAEMARAKTSSFPLCPVQRPGPTLLRHRQTKEPDSARPHLNRRATPRLHLIEASLPARP